MSEFEKFLSTLTIDVSPPPELLTNYYNSLENYIKTLGLSVNTAYTI